MSYLGAMRTLFGWARGERSYRRGAGALPAPKLRRVGRYRSALHRTGPALHTKTNAYPLKSQASKTSGK
jgi:hypothetical protein